MWWSRREHTPPIYAIQAYRHPQPESSFVSRLKHGVFHGVAAVLEKEVTNGAAILKIAVASSSGSKVRYVDTEKSLGCRSIPPFVSSSSPVSSLRFTTHLPLSLRLVPLNLLPIFASSRLHTSSASYSFRLSGSGWKQLLGPEDGVC